MPSHQCLCLTVLQTARVGLCDTVTDVIRKQVLGSSASPAEVPVDVIDAIIRREYSERGQGITMYIMNPEAVQASTASSADASRAFRYTVAPQTVFIVVSVLFTFLHSFRDDKMVRSYAYTPVASANAAPGIYPCFSLSRLAIKSHLQEPLV
jgi:hypothetical protein